MSTVIMNLAHPAYRVRNWREYENRSSTSFEKAEVPLSEGTKVPQVRRKLGGTEQTYYRWRKEHALSVGATTVQHEKNRSVVSPMSDYPRFPIRELNR